MTFAATAEIVRYMGATPILVAQTRAQAQANDASMRERLAQIQSSNEHTLTAPVSGRVIGLPVNLGQTVAGRRRPEGVRALSLASWRITFRRLVS